MDWLLGEALTNLYVGLQRELRGERLSAMRFIQGYALDRLVALAGRLAAPADNGFHPTPSPPSGVSNGVILRLPAGCPISPRVTRPTAPRPGRSWLFWMSASSSIRPSSRPSWSCAVPERASLTGLYTPRPLDPDLARRLEAMPKVELHVHLEGSVEPATIWELARRNRIKLPADSLAEWQSYFEFRDFTHFLAVYITSAACMRTPQDFALMTERFLANQARLNVRYTEAFLSASIFVGKLPADELIDALAAGVQAGEAEIWQPGTLYPRHRPPRAGDRLAGA